jgi:hypothetical protein
VQPIKKKIEADGFAETTGSSPEKMANTINSETEILTKVVKEAKTVVNLTMLQ